MANEENQPTKKRRIRPAAETVREKTAKTVAQADKPTKRSLIWRGFSAPFRLIGRGLSKIGRFLGKYKFFRVIGYIIAPPYLRNSWKELRQVSWPNGKLTRQLTFAVMLFAIVFGAFVALLDFGLDKLFKEVLLK